MEEVKKSSDARGRLVVAVALNGGSKSVAIMRWAIEKFVYEGNNVSFKLIHVFPRITGVPTPMGNLIPFPQVREDVVSAYKKEVEWQKTEMLLPYQRLCSLKKVSADIVLVEADEISSAISLEVAKVGAKNLIIGASSNSLFSRKVKGQVLSALISEYTPRFCAVYIVSKGKLESLRPSEEANWNPLDDSTSASDDSAFSSSRYSSSTLDPGSSTSDSPFSSPSQSMRRMEPIPSVKLSFNETTQESSDVSHWRSLNLSGDRGATSHVSGNSMVEGSMITRVTSSRSDSCSSENPSTLSSPSRQNSSQSLSSITQEIERLRIELRHIRGMCLMAETETTDASEKLSDLSMLRLEEAKKLKEMNEKEERAKELAKLEKEKADASKKETENTQKFALKEMYKRRGAELINVHSAKEKEKLKHSSFELRRSGRSDLKEKIHETNCSACACYYGPNDPPSHFKCPMLKSVMDDPCVAADGYTYDRKAIEMWLKENDTSPTTNFPLSNKNLIPNYSLHYAIMEWKSKTKPPRNFLRSF